MSLPCHKTGRRRGPRWLATGLEPCFAGPWRRSLDPSLVCGWICIAIAYASFLAGAMLFRKGSQSGGYALTAALLILGVCLSVLGALLLIVPS